MMRYILAAHNDTQVEPSVPETHTLADQSPTPEKHIAELLHRLATSVALGFITLKTAERRLLGAYHRSVGA